MTLNGTASAYVQHKRLCVLGVCDSPYGPIPFSHGQACDSEDGPIDFAKPLSAPVAAALEESERCIMNSVEKEEIRLAAEDLIDQARAGDQNAVAMLVCIRQSAEQGSKRARFTMKMLLRYARSKKSRAQFGGEETERVLSALSSEITVNDPMHYSSAVLSMASRLTVDQAGVTLSNGPRLDNSRISSLSDSFEGEDKEAFYAGINDWESRKESPSVPHRIGKCVGLARTIQLVRLPHTPISKLSKAAGWELD